MNVQNETIQVEKINKRNEDIRTLELTMNHDVQAENKQFRRMFIRVTGHKACVRAW